MGVRQHLDKSVKVIKYIISKLIIRVNKANLL